MDKVHVKVKCSVRDGETRHKAGSIAQLSVADAEMLVARGMAEYVDAPVAEDSGTVEGTLAGVVTAEGKAIALADMTKAELLAIAKDMEIEGVDKMTKAQLVEAIEAEKVKAPAAE